MIDNVTVLRFNVFNDDLSKINFEGKKESCKYYKSQFLRYQYY